MPVDIVTFLGWLPIIAVVLALWTIPWKAVALWKAARRGEKAWFIALLVVNTLAVLEILYIFIFSKRSMGSKQAVAPGEAGIVGRQ